MRPGDARAMEHVATVADQEVADALRLVALGFAGLATVALGFELHLRGDRLTRPPKGYEPVGGLDRLSVWVRQNGNPLRPSCAWLRTWAWTSSTSTAGMGNVRVAIPRRAVYKGPMVVMLSYCLTARSTLTGGMSPPRLKSCRFAARAPLLTLRHGVSHEHPEADRSGIANRVSTGSGSMSLSLPAWA